MESLKRDVLEDPEELAKFLPRYLSQDYNVFQVASADRGQFWVIGLLIMASLILFMYSM